LPLLEGNICAGMKNIILLFLLVITGCTASSHIIVGETHPAITADAVKIYDEKPAQSQSVAILTTRLDGLSQSKMDKAVMELKRQAALVGANGMVMGAMQQSQQIIPTGSSVLILNGSTLQATAFFVP
jgi:hypothetical protein